MSSWLNEEAYYERLFEEQEAEYWADQERRWEESVVETDSKESEKPLDSAESGE